MQRIDDLVLLRTRVERGRHTRAEVESREERRALRGVLNQGAAVRDRQLGDTHLLRRQESFDARRNRQRLEDRVVRRLDLRLRRRHAGHVRHRLVDLGKVANAVVRIARHVERRRRRRWRCFDDDVRCSAQHLERQEELVERRPFLERNHRSERRQLLATGRRVSRIVDRGVQILERLTYRCFAAVDADADARDRDVARRRRAVEHQEERCPEQIAVRVELADLEHDVRVGFADL